LGNLFFCMGGKSGKSRKIESQAFLITATL